MSISNECESQLQPLHPGSPPPVPGHSPRRRPPPQRRPDPQRPLPPPRRHPHPRRRRVRRRRRPPARALSFALALFRCRSRSGPAPPLVGFFGHAHDLDPAPREWVYGARRDRYSILLAKFLLLRRVDGVGRAPLRVAPLQPPPPPTNSAASSSAAPPTATTTAAADEAAEEAADETTTVAATVRGGRSRHAMRGIVRGIRSLGDAAPAAAEAGDEVAASGSTEARGRSGSAELEDDGSPKTFAGLGVCEELVEACKSLGWETPSKIQAEAIPYALQCRDVIGLAQTGSGKTGAFALPILQVLLQKPQPFFACVLSPTRSELAIQISEQFEALGSGIGVKCSVLVGGVDMMQQAISLAKRPHIVVATPGRLLDHLSNTKGFSLRALKYLVLDEADRLLNMDFERAIDDILKDIPKERRTYLFSATMTKKVSKLQRACLRDPLKIEAASKYSTVDTLKQHYLFIPATYKDCYLVYILVRMSGSTSMVFTRTCESARLLALILRNLGLSAIPINGQMSQAKRLGSLNKFKSGECNILICTDVASRGLDIPSVDVVINYNIPTNSKDYIHRVGRTARAGRSGLAISLVNQYEVEWYRQIELLIGKELPEYQANKEEVLLLLERVSDARRIAQMKLKGSEVKRKKRRVEDVDEEAEKHAITHKNSKASKKSRRR
uniref:DEAD-box ATP-dependent RNA helicase 10 n=1 Tax=Ananas comosus var. bracteatus TaxID=296719 RepID=A0A6V7P197_ANACO|nr:unnamed protein product [Ananas comosus var. bracteatus]